MEVKVGSVVISNSGHDKGETFIITSINENYAYICNGTSRSLEKPKKKKLKHLNPTKEVCEQYLKLSESKHLINNSQIKKLLKLYK